MNMTLKPLYDNSLPANLERPLRVAGFMSGSGTNIKKILARVEELKKEGKNLFELVFLFSDKDDPETCKIAQIASEQDIPYEINDIWNFYLSKGKNDKRDLKLRKEYDAITLGFLQNHDIDAVALGGYMSIVTDVIFNAYPTLNVHPADLRILTPEGRRKYIGDNAVRDAILAGEKYLRSSVHLVTEQVDGGPLIIVSKPLEIKLPEAYTIDFLKKPENKDYLEKLTELNQDRLKKVGDWVIFPKALELLAEGRISQDENGNIYVDGKPGPLVLE